MRSQDEINFKKTFAIIFVMILVYILFRLFLDGAFWLKN